MRLEEIQGRVAHAELHLLVSVSLARCHVEAMACLPFSGIQNTKLVWSFHCGLDPGICAFPPASHVDFSVRENGCAILPVC